MLDPGLEVEAEDDDNSVEVRARDILMLDPGGRGQG
jgi:hypothetical protein